MLDRQQINSLFKYGLSLTMDRSLAEDLLQTTLEQLLKRDHKPTHIVAYARTIMRNRFIDQCRRRKILSFDSIEQYQPVLIGEEDLEKAIVDQDSIEKLLIHLTNGEREVLFLWAVEGYNATEIANEIGTARGTVLTRLYRIRQKLIKVDQQFNIVGDRT